MRLSCWVVPLVVVAACVKDRPRRAVEDDPAASFAAGLAAVTEPDRRTGGLDYPAAYEAFVRSSELGGGPRASFNAGWVAERLGRPADAERHYRAAWEADATYTAAIQALARVVGERGDAADAVHLYALHAAAHPDDPTAQRDLLAAQVRGGRFDDALATARELLRRDPADAAVYRSLSALYRARGDRALARLTAGKALALDAADPRAHNDLGVTALIEGDEAAAIESFRAALRLQPANFEANMNLGFTALDSGDYVRAKDCFDRAAAADPDDLDAMLGLAVSLRGLGDLRAAGALYDRILAADPRYEAAYKDAARLHYLHTGDFGRARRYLEAWLAVAGAADEAALEELAEIDAREAADSARKALEADRAQAERERRQRNEDLLDAVAATVASTRARLAASPGCVDPDSLAGVLGILDQAQQVVDAGESDLAPDVAQQLDAWVPAVDEALARCEEAGTPGTP